MTIHLRVESFPYPPSRDDAALLCPGSSGWKPQRVLRRLGAADDSSETLIRLLLACAIVEGPNRIEELVLQIDRLCAGYVSHLETKMGDQMYAPLHPLMRSLMDELRPPRVALGATRARLANSILGPEISLIHHDLRAIVHFGRLAVFGYLIGTSRGRVAAEQLVEAFSKAPFFLDAEHWRERLFPSGDLVSVRLFEPKDYGRVVVVMRDGVLMYDPKSEDLKA